MLMHANAYMNNFHSVLTVDQYAELFRTRARQQHLLSPVTPEWIEEHRQLAAAPDEMCQCGKEKVWKLGSAGMCFTCTTGEASADDDYEIRP